MATSKARTPRQAGRAAYEAKRNPATTPEPAWRSRPRQGTTGGRLFVVQKHAARRLHYDLRLEIEGALASWAVPKGIPQKRGSKHLAVKVEDHPLDYAGFEGIIPPGNYGAGAVMLWDRGLYEVLEGEPAAAVRKGRLSLVFAGEKLRGHWVLVRTGSDDRQEQWLLMRGKDDEEEVPAKDADRSVASGRTLEEISEGAAPPGSNPPNTTAPRRPRRNRSIPAAIRDLPTEDPGFVPPMKPHLSAHLPRQGEWTYEIKFDGYRIIAVKDRDQTTLYSRNQRDVSAEFPEVRDAVAGLPVDRLVFDAEVVALQPTGLASFQLLQNRGRRGGGNRPPIYCYAFDLLHLQGRKTTTLPLTLRKQLLQELLEEAGDPLRFSAGIDSDPKTFLSQAQKLGLEGLLAKESGSPYHPGRRSRSWLKIKLHNQQEFVIGGYTPPKGSRSRFGAVIVGVYQGKALHYVARVGTGFDERALERAYRMFQPLRTRKCPFVNLPAARTRFGGGLTAAEMKRSVWLRPELVCEVKFTEWTDDGGLRHPVFLGFRDDKSPREIIREQPAA